MNSVGGRLYSLAADAHEVHGPGDAFMGEERRIANGWAPAVGTYEEAVLSWHEQVEAAVRRAGKKTEPERDGPSVWEELSHHDPRRNPAC
jgi:hypothetical protein